MRRVASGAVVAALLVMPVCAVWSARIDPSAGGDRYDASGPLPAVAKP